MTSSRASWPLACVALVGLVSGIHLQAPQDTTRRGGLREPGGDHGGGIGSERGNIQRLWQEVVAGARGPAEVVARRRSSPQRLWQDWLDMANFRPPWPKRDDEPVRGTDKDGHRQRVAVLTSGTLKRYFLAQAAEGLVRPMVEAGFAVDYYLALNTAEFEAWNSLARRYRPDSAPLDNLTAIEKMIKRTISKAGGQVCRLHFLSAVEVDGYEKNFIRAGAWNGLRSGVHARTNALKMLKPLQGLGEAMQRVEAKRGKHGAYDYVIILKDDSIWLKPFDLTMLLRNTLSPVAPKQHGYVLRCDKGMSTFSPPAYELTEYIFVLQREVATPFYMMHSLLVNGSMSGEVDLLQQQMYRNATNFEEFAKQVATGFKILLQPTPPILLPMQRGARLEVDGEVKSCLHKFCDSQVQGLPSLRPKSVYPACSDLQEASERRREVVQQHLRQAASKPALHEELEYEEFS